MARDTTWDHWNPPSHRTDPKTVLTFGCLPYGNNTTCREIHPHGDIDPKSGSSMMCACCHVGGKENQPMRAIPVGSQLNPDYVPDLAPPTVYAKPPAKPKAPVHLGLLTK